jgi:hypothetical protein
MEKHELLCLMASVICVADMMPNGPTMESGGVPGTSAQESRAAVANDAVLMAKEIFRLVTL